MLARALATANALFPLILDPLIHYAVTPVSVDLCPQLALPLDAEVEAPLLAEVEAKLAAFVPQNVANAVWAAATLALRPGVQLLDALVAHFQGQLAQANSQARVLLSAMRRSHSYAAHALRARSTRHECLRCPSAARTAESCACYCALRKGTRRWCDVSLILAVWICPMQALSNVFWGLATLDHDPGSGFWTAAEARLTQLAPDCEAQHLSNAAWAFAKLQRQPGACAKPMVLEWCQQGRCCQHSHWETELD